jgi:hypothetical protein
VTALGQVLLTCQLSAAEATVDAAAAHLGVPADAIDPEFGVVLIDPKTGSYAVMVDEDHADAAAARDDVSGPWANPRIEAFGPPEAASGHDADRPPRAD